jgi:predicted phosphodiesterase
MKIVVISDTHGDLSALRRVALIENDADLYLHAGDVEASPGISRLSPRSKAIAMGLSPNTRSVTRR